MSKNPTRSKHRWKPIALVATALIAAAWLNWCHFSPNKTVTPSGSAIGPDSESEKTLTAEPPAQPEVSHKIPTVEVFPEPGNKPPAVTVNETAEPATEEVVAEAVASGGHEQPPAKVSPSPRSKPLDEPEDRPGPDREQSVLSRPDDERMADLPASLQDKWAWLQRASGLDPGRIEGRFVQSFNTSKGVYSDRSYTVFESTLELAGSGGIAGFGLRWRGRYAPGEDLSEDIPANFLEEAWYGVGDPAGAYRLTLGRHYIDAAAAELVDGVSLEKKSKAGLSIGAFFGFRPDPYDYAFRPDAFSGGLYSAWRAAGDRTWSRQALVVSYFEKELDRTYFTWEAGTVVRKNVTVRQYVVLDADLEQGDLSLTDYALTLDVQPHRDLWVGWKGEVYRNVFFEASSEDIPTDTSATYRTSLALRYAFSRFLIGRASVEFSHRAFDHSDALSWSLGADLPDLLRSGVTMSLLYTGNDYYNARFDSYSASLARTFGQRLSLSLGLKYWRNRAASLPGSSESEFYAMTAGGSYLLTDRIDLSVFYEYQRSRYGNGSTLGLGFERDSRQVGTSDSSRGHNFSLIFQYRL